jgi:hypothetical protein
LINPSGWVILLHGHGSSPAWNAVPHVHVFGDGEARIDVLDLKDMTQGGMSDGDVRRAVEVIEASQQLFLDTWRTYHG